MKTKFGYKIATLVLFASLTSTALAGSVDIAGLTDAQIADLNARAALIKADNLGNKAAPTANNTVSTIPQYAQLGKDLGVGLASTARELGVAANDFASSRVGHIATALIIYKVLGRDILHIVCGFLWTSGATILFIYFFRKMYMYDSVTENFDPTSGKRTSVVRKPMNPRDVDVQVGRVIMGIAFGVSMLIGLWITFSG